MVLGSLVKIGLPDLPKLGGGGGEAAPPASSVLTALC